MRRLRSGGAIPELAERGRTALGRFYAALDADPGNGAYVAGENFTIADITALCAIDFATAAARTPIPDECAFLYSSLFHRMFGYWVSYRVEQEFRTRRLGCM